MLLEPLLLERCSLCSGRGGKLAPGAERLCWEVEGDKPPKPCGDVVPASCCCCGCFSAAGQV